MAERPLSQREAERCEQATTPVCKCRCRGALHGARRVPSGGDFSVLHTDDPHYRPPLTKKEALTILRDAYAYVQIRGEYATPQWHSALTLLANATTEIVRETEGG
jgi:hypothetical protein